LTTVDELAIRHITFWRDGFTFDDGVFMRYDDLANVDVLKAIHAGCARSFRFPSIAANRSFAPRHIFPHPYNDNNSS
jgi:hypothetical protein